MLNNILSVGAVIGGIIGIFAYLPQIWHLVRIKNSAGLSTSAWTIWLVGNILLLIYAISILNYPYIIVESLYCSANIVLIILTIRYKKET